MPAASSSRRKARRQNSEDIEMDGSTQDQVDDVESDEDAPRQSGRRSGKQAVKPSKKKPQVQESEGEGAADEDQESDDERIDVSNFTDQPITKANAQFIHGMASDWINCDKVIRQNWNLMNDIGIALADAAEGDDSEPEEIAELDQIVREAIDISAKFQNHSKVLDDIYQKVSRGEEISDAMDRYFSGVKSENREYKKKTSRQKYAKVQEYIDFRTGIWDATHPDTPMPPLTNFIKKEEGDDSDDDDELEIGGQTQDYKCPITLTLLVNPLTS
ncbi:hypothetical protein EST38_g1451 [Candolleomyces aberdarensis]|uniref:SP-RING-type domain-containing protein n=1 Tax=Candolleomyces aberdarensis TaxID=2316362 RepID=A0A4Q2DY69_9AGAR|nr:hypothetical protein EST38_g1451 [Candolleomyces aberdarensis]